MRIALDLPNFPPLGTPEQVAALAAAASSAWDGLFVWDHLVPLDGADRVHDTWELLKAAATANARLVVGPMIVAVGRREAVDVAERAHELAAAAPGRVIVGFGAGNRTDLRAAGVDLRDAELRALVVERASALRAALDPEIPLWTSGRWPPRAEGLLGAEVAAGALPIAIGGAHGWGAPPPDQVAAVREQAAVVAFTGRTSAAGEVPLSAYADAGLDWWLEDLYRVDPGEAVELARRGPGPSVAGLEAP